MSRGPRKRAVLMTAPVNPQACSPLPVDPVIVFRLRSEAYTRLCSAGEIELRDAVDVLQEAANRLALQVLQPVRDPAHQRREDGPSMQEIVTKAFRRRGVPKSTLDALEYVLRQDDPARLKQFLHDRDPQELAVLKTHAAGYLTAMKVSA